MKIAIYSRKSKFTGKGESIENQVVLCREYIQRNIPEAKDSDILVYEDEGFSAKNLDRPQFRLMMQSARKQPRLHRGLPARPYQQKCRRFRNAHRRA
ncbi:MAG: recombinase family protein [Oscillospiraceae bacterium]